MNNIIHYKNCKVHFTTQGKGRAVVLLHGFLENSRIWQDISKVLSQRFRVICIDLLGHGQTGNLGYVHTMDDQAQMLKAVLKHLRLRKVVLVGHSMGGYVALAFAKIYPDNVTGICLLNSTPLADSKTKKQDRNRAIFLVKKNPKSLIQVAIPNLFAKKNRDVFKKEIQHILKEALKTSQQGIIAALEGMKERQDLRDVLKNKSFKKCVFWGTQDTAVDTKALLKTLGAYKDVPIIELDGGHMGFIENKESVLKYLHIFCSLCFKS